ncbi:MFS transporter [Pseudomonas viridiflava]|uniref:MFS transporter n=1 Tax=Pseudomonas viridiflava TaxID=33069 RepID=UPI000F04B4E8|nr:MFS transporter [Pseudomonas viridiflava]
MTENDYTIAWGLYAFAALGCLLVGFLMTRWMWRYLREPLVVILGVLLFTPTMIDATKEIYAPAVAITALDLLFKVGSNVWNALSDLAMYGMIALVVYVVFALIRWPLEKSWKARHPQKPAQPEAATETEEDDEPFSGTDRYARKPAAPTVNTSSRSRVEPRL